jgi:hypothetical protein
MGVVREDPSARYGFLRAAREGVMVAMAGHRRGAPSTVSGRWSLQTSEEVVEIRE